jgi:apolipoprotein N-acyltransferase
MTRLTVAAAALGSLAGWRRYGLALLLGVALAGAQAPLSLWPLAFIVFVGLMLLLSAGSGRTGFFTLFAFAYGYFVAGLYWIGIAFFVDAEKFALLLPLPVLGLPLLLALFPAAGGWLALQAAGTPAPRRALLLPFGWLVGEFLRGHVLTGFPWNVVGAIWGDWPALMQLAAFIGVQGLGLLTMLAASGLALVLMPLPRSLRLAALLLPAGFALALGLGSLRLPATASDTVPDVQLRLVQPSVPQQMKWRDELRQQHLREHASLSLTPAAVPPTHIIWPETATPYLLDEEPALRDALAKLLPVKSGALITGAPRRMVDARQRQQIFNSVIAVDATGSMAGVYDKLHLVPFGEYLPFRSLLKPLGLDALAAGATDFSPGLSAATLAIPGLPAARVLICYEAIFPDEIALPGQARPGLLLNVTNDGWFGRSSGPWQHLNAARFRAIEQGLPLVRAANNGISAIVDPYGRITVSLSLNAVGVVDGPLPRALNESPSYARIGDIPLLGFSLLLLGLAFVALRRSIKD